MAAGGSGLLGASSSTFDLYDFFSMLIPGAALVLGVLPFAPKETPVDAAGLVVVLLVSGYITGRGLHTIAESIDNILGNRSHRDFFVDVLQGTEELLDPATVDEFYDVATTFADSPDLPDDRADASATELETLYLYVRARIHMHGQGRSRTFQAIHAFYRSTHLTFVCLAILYFVFGAGVFFGLFTGIGSFTSYWGTLGLSGNTFVAISELIAAVSLAAFHDAKGDYREYFIQYLLIDFLMIESSPD